MLRRTRPATTGTRLARSSGAQQPARGAARKAGTRILGSGGFGTVMQDATRTNIAHKLMSTHVQCKQSEREYNIHKDIYATYAAFVAAHPNFRERIAVPKPVAYQPCQNACRGKCYPCGPPYHCAYSMQRVDSGRADGIMRHVLLNTDYENFGGTVMSRDSGRIGRHTNYINNKTKRAVGGTRGAMLGQRQLTNFGFNLERLAYDMGMLFQIIKVAGWQPKDVEYVLGMPPRLAGRRTLRSSAQLAKTLYAMDFGMCDQRMTLQDVDYDMYVPGEDDPLRATFNAGRQVVNAWRTRMIGR